MTDDEKIGVIKRIILEEFNTNEEAIKVLGKNGNLSRKENVVRVRRFIYYICYKHLQSISLSNCSEKTLGLVQDHTTVLNSLQKHDDYLITEKEYLQLYNNILEKIGKEIELTLVTKGNIKN